MTPELLIGIDPGKYTGWAEYDTHTRKILRTLKLDFWGTVERLQGMKDRGLVFRVYIEDPNGNETTFQKKYVYGNRSSVREKISQDVGRNKQEALLLMQYMEREKIPFTAVVPTRTKLDAEAFQQLSGYKKRISQHERDAGRILLGR